jgi:hypothetical protein
MGFYNGRKVKYKEQYFTLEKGMDIKDIKAGVYKKADDIGMLCLKR